MMALLVSLKSRLSGASEVSDPAAKQTLGEALEALEREDLSAESFADRAVELVRSKASVTAAALLKHDPRRNRMEVLAASGLEPDAVRSIEGRGPGTWEIPAHALANRRIHVIEAAHKNPFVPQEVKALGRRGLQIAIVPFYFRGEGAGVLALFSASSQPFSDPLIHAVARGVRGIAPVVARVPAGNRAVADGSAHGGLLQGLGSLREERDELRRTLEESERRAAEQAAERVSAESFLRAEQERAAELESELDSLRGRLTELDARRSESQSRTEGLERRIQELEARLENDRTTFSRDRSELEEEVSRFRQELTESSDARQAIELRSRELEQRLDATAERLHAVENEKAALEERLGDAERRAQDGSAAGEELQKLRDELREVVEAREQAETRSRELEERLGEAERAVESFEAERGALQERLAHAERAAGDRSEAEETLQKSRHELEEKLAAATREAETLRGELAERDGLLRELEVRLAGSPEEPVVLGADEQELPIDRSGNLEATGAEEELDITTLTSGFEVFVVDAGRSAEAVVRHLSEVGLEVRRPDGAVPDGAGAILVNLASPDAGEVLRERAAVQGPSRAPVYGYVQPEGADRGRWLGRIDVAHRDCDGEEIARRLGGFGVNVRRVLAVSDDPELMSKLREDLRGHRISAAIVLDAKQALDLVGAVRPDAAVVHLSRKSTGLLDTVADLQREGPGRELPTVLLVEDGEFPTQQIGKLVQKCDTSQEQLFATFQAVLGVPEQAA